MRIYQQKHTLADSDARMAVVSAGITSGRVGHVIKNTF